MPLPPELREELARRRAAESEEAGRETRRDLTLAALQCVFWSAAGILCVLWSAHTTDVALGRAAFYGGLAIGNGGVIFTLLAAYRRGEQRGDW